MRAPWVKLDATTTGVVRYYCARCGGSELPPVSVPLEAAVLRARAFAGEHENCRQPSLGHDGVPPLRPALRGRATVRERT